MQVVELGVDASIRALQADLGSLADEEPTAGRCCGGVEGAEAFDAEIPLIVRGVPADLLPRVAADANAERRGGTTQLRAQLDATVLIRPPLGRLVVSEEELAWPLKWRVGREGLRTQLGESLPSRQELRPRRRQQPCEPRL